MNRRLFLKNSLLFSVATSFSGFAIHAIGHDQLNNQQEWQKTDQEWKNILSDIEYKIMRKNGTESPYSSGLNDNIERGIYACAACGLHLFSSKHKYNSGTGWPSFYDVIDLQHIETKQDYKLLFPRTEYHCARCGSHQGHVFNDGPQPTGLRYCNNGIALVFISESSMV